MNRLLLALLLIIASISGVQAQTTYKCRNANGKIEFSDKPCNVGSKTEKVLAPEYFPEEERIRAQQRAARASQELAEIEISKQRPQESMAETVCKAASEASRDEKQTPRRRTQLIYACKAISQNPDSQECRDMASVALDGSAKAGKFTALYELCKATSGNVVRRKADNTQEMNSPSRPCVPGSTSDSNCFVGANPRFSGAPPRYCIPNDPNDSGCIR